ncbi:hypothetical protein CRG98_009946 [Punica granatum]|uniref:Uncharacterized protein n=1 Tax=Punica granatum TaxID=22663 RepID=A0A2I0KMF1_PUNGR|nr:hypothetical protein CRG98_009946 [Punica granatum]
MCYDQKPSPSRPPIPHDKRVVPTFAGRLLAAFTLPPRQDELWPECRSTFPGEQYRKQISVTAWQSPVLFPNIDICFHIFCTFLSTPHLLHWAPALHRAPALHLAPALHRAPAPYLLHRASAPFLGFSHSSGFDPTFGLQPLIELRPCIGLRPCIYCIGLWPHFWASAPLLGFSHSSGSGLASGSGPAFTALGFGPTLGSNPASGSGPAYTASSFGPAAGFGPTFGFRPLIGLRPRFWASTTHRASAPLLGFDHSSGFGPTFGLQPHIYCIEPQSCIYCFRPLAQHLLLLGSDPAFTAFRF